MAKILSRGHTVGAIVLGAIELACGILVIILSVVMAKKANLPASFSPWWAGVIFAIPGAIGIVVGITRNYCAMIAFMVINIIAFIIQGVGAVLLGIAMAIFVSFAKAVEQNCTYYRLTEQCICNANGESLVINGMSSCAELSSVASMAIAIIVFLVIAGCISLAAAIVGCCGTCCNNDSE